MVLPKKPDDDSPPPARLRFGLMQLLLFLTAFCVMAGVLSGMVNAQAGPATFALIGVAAPLGLMIAISLWLQVVKRLRRPKR